MHILALIVGPHSTEVMTSMISLALSAFMRFLFSAVIVNDFIDGLIFMVAGCYEQLLTAQLQYLIILGHLGCASLEKRTACSAMRWFDRTLS